MVSIVAEKRKTLVRSVRWRKLVGAIIGALASSIFLSLPLVSLRKSTSFYYEYWSYLYLFYFCGFVSYMVFVPSGI